MNILSHLGIKPDVLKYFLPYIETLTENAATFSYRNGSDYMEEEAFKAWHYTIPVGQATWTIHPPYAPAVTQHFLFHSAIEALCFFNLHSKWLCCPSSIAISSIGLSPEPGNVTRLLAAFPNARLHFAFGNDLCGQLMDCLIPLWLNQQYWHFAYDHGLLNVDDGLRKFSVCAENFSLNSLFKPGSSRHFKKEKPRGGYTSFYEQLRYPSFN